MTTNIAKIRAALESALARATSGSRVAELRDAIAALAELENAAAEPARWECEYADWNDETQIEMRREPPTVPGRYDKITPLYTTPPPAKPAPQFVAGEVTQEMCQRVAASFYGADTFSNGVEMHEVLQLWRKELGPALGLVEIREPTPEECKQICTEYERLLMREGTCGGRDAFDAVRAVMWPKERA